MYTIQDNHLDNRVANRAQIIHQDNYLDNLLLVDIYLMMFLDSWLDKYCLHHMTFKSFCFIKLWNVETLWPSSWSTSHVTNMCVRKWWPCDEILNRQRRNEWLWREKGEKTLYMYPCLCVGYCLPYDQCVYACEWCVCCVHVCVCWPLHLLTSGDFCHITLECTSASGGGRVLDRVSFYNQTTMQVLLDFNNHPISVCFIPSRQTGSQIVVKLQANYRDL